MLLGFLVPFFVQRNADLFPVNFAFRTPYSALSLGQSTITSPNRQPGCKDDDGEGYYDLT